MNDSNELVQSVVRGCAEAVGPLISLDLEVGDATSEITPVVPEGDLAVLPLSAELGGESIAGITLSSPIHELVTLARRTLGDDDPDKQRDLSSDDMDAMGEVLNLMSNAVDQSVRELVNGDLRTHPQPWWRSSEPGDNGFAEGEHLLGRGSVSVPGGSTISLYLRIAPDLLARGAEGAAHASARRVVLVGLDDAACAPLKQALEAERFEVSSEALDAGVTDAIAAASAILVGGVDEKSLAFLRSVRLDDRTWTVPTVACVAEPTREDVVRATAAGAYHVFRLDGDAATLPRRLESLRQRRA